LLYSWNLDNVKITTKIEGNPGIRGAAMARDAYHHGNLRPALVEAARERLEREGVQGVTLRSVAAQVGVSHAAPYAHFRDKNALLAALAAAGFRELHARLRASRDAVGGSSCDPLARTGRAYVAFARAHPALYALMFGPLPDAPRSEELEDAAAQTWRELQEVVASTVAPSDAGAAAVAAWSLVHGLASLLNASRIRVGGADGDGGTALAERVTQWFADRIAREPGPGPLL